MEEMIQIFAGPKIGEGMLYVSLNLIAFLVTLLLVLRISTGKLSKPVFLISLGFFISAVVPITLGEEYLWTVPVIQTLFSLFGIMGLMDAFGVFELLSKKKDK